LPNISKRKDKKIKQDKKKGFEPDEMKSSSMTKKKNKKTKDRRH
jgi:hypothetical protein